MKVLKPYSTLLVGIILGFAVLPKVASKLNVNLPGA